MQDSNNTEEYIDISELDQSDIGKKDGFYQKFKEMLNSKYFFILVSALLAIIAFLLGRISAITKSPVTIYKENTILFNAGEVKGLETVKEDVSFTNGEVVASKTGTKYHYPWCAGAKQISLKNKIMFKSIEEAKAKGYLPASNCKGLK